MYNNKRHQGSALDWFDMYGTTGKVADSGPFVSVINTETL